jgi:4-amino-4-deoxy-L-arabinose transferase-like glycosyltransferase
LKVFKRVIPEDAKGAFRLSFCLCLLACMFIIFVIAPLTGISRDFSKGHDGYIEIARNLGQGNGYVFEESGPAVFHRPPLYPFLLVPITFLPDYLERPALIFIQSVMVGCIGALIFQMAKSLFGLSTAKISVIIFLLNPWVYWNAKNPMTVIVQGLLYTLFAVLLGRRFLAMRNGGIASAFKGESWSGRLATGAAAGALALTHGAMLAACLVSFLVLFITAVVRRNYQAIKTVFVTVVIMAALIAPWTYRNWLRFGRFIPVVTGSSLAYFNGNAHWRGITEEPQHQGEGYIDASLRLAGIEGTEQTHTHWKGFKDIETSDKADQRMVEDLRSNPGVFIKKVVLNAVEYYFPMLAHRYLAVKGSGVRYYVQKTAITIFNSVLWILALIGVLRDRREGTLWLAKGLLLIAILLYSVWFLPFATFIGHSLYTFGTIPFLSILAARGLGSVGVKSA